MSFAAKGKNNNYKIKTNASSHCPTKTISKTDTHALKADISVQSISRSTQGNSLNPPSPGGWFTVQKMNISSPIPAFQGLIIVLVGHLQSRKWL